MNILNNDLPAIAFQDVSKTYQTKKGKVEALTYPFNLFIENFESSPIISLIGSNGSGKTTFLSILGGLIRPNTGSLHHNLRPSHFTNNVINLSGSNYIDIEKTPLEAKKHIIFTFQESKFDSKYSIERNLLFHGAIWGLTRTETINCYKPLLQEFGLWEKRKYKPFQVSGGQAKQIEMIRGLMLPTYNHSKFDIHLFIADEPTAYCDIEARRKIWDLLREKNDDGILVFLATNDLKEAEVLSKELIFLRKGKVIAQGPPDTIRNHMTKEKMIKIDFETKFDAEQLLKSYLSTLIDIKSDYHIEKNSSGYSCHLWCSNTIEEFANISRIAMNQKIKLSKIEIHKINLEDIFSETFQTPQGGNMIELDA